MDSVWRFRARFKLPQTGKILLWRDKQTYRHTFKLKQHFDQMLIESIQRNKIRWWSIRTVRYVNNSDVYKHTVCLHAIGIFHLFLCHFPNRMLDYFRPCKKILQNGDRNHWIKTIKFRTGIRNGRENLTFHFWLRLKHVVKRQLKILSFLAKFYWLAKANSVEVAHAWRADFSLWSKKWIQLRFRY